MSISRNAPQLGDQGNYDVFLITNSSLAPPDNGLSYGTQPPVIEPAMGMELVNDTFDLDRGPAWFRMLSYNKTVLVPEDLLTESSSSKVRRRGGFPPAQHKNMARVGDKPWVCYWPGTIVEVFIYAEQNSSYASQTMASTGGVTAAPTATTPWNTPVTDFGAMPTPTGNVVEFMPLASYPRVVKVKERRVHQEVSPYCVQITINDDNTTSPVLNSDGSLLTIYIDEEEPGPVAAEAQEDDSKRKWRRYMREPEATKQWLLPRDDDGDMSACGCMWFSS